MTASRERDAELARLEAALGHVFTDRALLEQALCHASYAHARRQADQPALEHNERLEFLGDAVLGHVVAEALYAAKPDWREGALTRALHAIVEGRSLSRLAIRLDIGTALRLGPTEQASGGAQKPSILENALEAIVGAMYLDAGLPAVAAFVAREFGDAVAADAAPVARDPKTALQERLMAEVGAFPTYRVVHDSQQEGDDERFTLAVESEGRVLAQARGRTKRQAERRAARRALEQRETADPRTDDVPDDGANAACDAQARTGGG